LVTFPLLEQAVRSQFILLHRYQGEPEAVWIRRSAGAHPLYCDPVEGPKTLALMVFLGLMEDYRLDEDEGMEFLNLDQRTTQKCIRKFEGCYEAAERVIKRGHKLHPHTLEAKVYFKAGMVRRKLVQLLAA
jgi:hypothetical protein